MERIQKENLGWSGHMRRMESNRLTRKWKLKRMEGKERVSLSIKRGYNK